MHEQHENARDSADPDFDPLPDAKDATPRHEQLLEHGPDTLHDDYVRHSCIIGRDVEIWEETAGEQEDAERLATGRVADIQPDLSLRLDGVAEPVRRGRLIFAD